MNKNTKTVLVVAIVVFARLALACFAKEYIAGWQDKPDCGGSEGTHYSIDMRNFATKYTSYTVALEGELKDTAQFSVKLGESQFQQLSDSLQRTNEFRKATSVHEAKDQL